MRLQRGQDLPREALHLIEEHFVRHDAAVEADENDVRAGVFGGFDDALGDLFSGAPGLGLDLLGELLNREVAVVLASAGDGREVSGLT